MTWHDAYFRIHDALRLCVFAISLCVILTVFVSIDKRNSIHYRFIESCIKQYFKHKTTYV